MWSIPSAQASSYQTFLRDANAATGAFLSLADTPLTAGATDAPLTDVPIAVKDNIAVQDQPLTCGSRMLAEYRSPYSATAVERLIAAGAAIVGKTNLDEFGMGSSTTNSALGVTTNPWDRTRVAGGSSGGSAVAVAAQLVPAAIGTDTGGSIRQPAAFCGVYGLKPSYGAVSRYGLVAYASSLETIGPIAADLDGIELLFRAMAGSDTRDQTTRNSAAAERAETRKICVLDGDLGLDAGVERAYRRSIEAVQAQGYSVEPVRLTTQQYVVPAYYTIASAEASANLARYNGVRYGHRPDYAENPEQLARLARTEGFGDEVKLRIVLGTYVLRSGFQDQYYLRAQKIRTLIGRELERLFTSYDAMLLPVFPTQAFPLEGGLDAFQQKVADRFTCTANLAGTPALAIPAGVEDGLPTGVQLMGPAGADLHLVQIARRLARALPLEFPADTAVFDQREVLR